MSEPAVHSERRDGVAVIVIDHPPVNALAQPVRSALLAAVEAAESTLRYAPWSFTAPAGISSRAPISANSTTSRGRRS